MSFENSAIVIPEKLILVFLGQFLANFDYF